MISKISLKNYRSYKAREFELSDGVNMVVGQNGAGKTNLLEAVYVLARGSTFRLSDSDLVKRGEDWARIDGLVDGVSRSLKIVRENDRLDKTFVLDDKNFKRLSFDKVLPVVLFEPNQMNSITRGPNSRREFFDSLLAENSPLLKSLLNKYKRTLAQRNSLLKQPRSFVSKQIFAWDVRLAELAEQVVMARAELARNINKDLGLVYSDIADKKTQVELIYTPTFSPDSYASKMVDKLGLSLEQDLLRGFTGVGPHREDFTALIDSIDVRHAASRGESRSIMLALKIYEMGLMELSRGQKPILLLDDVFSELDNTRRAKLTNIIQGYQTIITTTDGDQIKGLRRAPKLLISVKS